MSGALWKWRRPSRGPGATGPAGLTQGTWESRRWLDRGLVLAFVALVVAAIVNGIRSDAGPGTGSEQLTERALPNAVDTGHDQSQALAAIVPLSGDLRAEG